MSAGNSNTGLNGTWFGVDTAGNGLVNVRGAFPLLFSTSALERMRLDSSGNLGIGTTSVNARLDVYSATDLGAGANGIRVQRPGSYGQYGYLEYLISSDITVLGSLYTGGGASSYGQIYFRQHSSTTSRDVMVINASGNVGIGTTSPGEKLDVVNGGLGVGNGTIKTVVSYTTEGIVGTTSNHALLLYANNTERARIHAGGGLTVGATQNDGVLTSVQTAADAVQFSLRDNTNTRRAIFLGNGNFGYQWSQVIYANGGKAFAFANVSGTEVGSIVINSGGVAFNTTSDYRLKDNPQSLTGSGAFIDRIKPKTWVWKADGTKGVGFIAHELAEVAPLSVSGKKDAMRVDQVKDENGQYVEKEIPSYQSVDYGSAEIIANLVAEIQSLRQRVAQLESK
jgi:hypothetical protein